LVAINGVPIAEAVALITPLIAHDNDKTIEVVVPMYLMISEILEGTGIVTDLRPWIPPDIAVELSSADYFSGFDPVLQAAIDA